ncbi:hypothetical protein JK358_25360 [Nocardia sp. 2]|uniref:DUF1444 domain-containing protein n=1 Tax=Nocardia acididurans TaxID=2802282 RepID=A0ABS1MBW1_9NOCA|nr:hypothetical protein [Nocardia acididurans]MBL1077734.1 hypothetical protein [Nocardia acididurans]
MGFLGGIFGSARKKFGRKVLQQVLAHGSVASADYDPADDTVLFQIRGGGTGWINVAMLYRRFDGCAGPELSAMVYDMVQAAVSQRSGATGRAGGAEQPEDTWEQVAATVRPVLRPAGHDLVRVGDRNISGVVLTRRVLPYLVEMVAIDRPTTIQFVTAQHLLGWGVDADTVYAAAHENMTELAMSALTAFEPAEGTRILEFDDDEGETYIGALPLIPGWLAGVAARTGTRPVVFLPGHLGMYLVLGAAEGSASEEMLPQLLALAEEKYDRALRPVSPVPYTVDDDGELIPLRLPETHPAWRALQHAEATLAAKVYGAQTDKLRADADREAAVSDLLQVRDQDGTEYTMTPWTGYGNTILLPRANYICFVGRDGDAFRVAWDDVAELVDLHPAEEYDPPRYRVAGHPSAEIMTRLRALAS